MANVRFHVAFVMFLALCAAVAAWAGNGDPRSPSAYQLAFTSTSRNCPESTRGALFGQCSTLFVVDVGDGRFDFGTGVPFRRSRHVRNIATLPFGVAAIAIVPSEPRLRYLQYRAEGGRDAPFQLHVDLWSAQLDGSERSEVQRDFDSGSPSIDPLPVLLGNQTAIPVDAARRLPSSAVQSGDGTMVAFVLDGADGSFLCVKPSVGLNLPGPGKCFYALGLGNPAWIDY